MRKIFAALFLFAFLFSAVSAKAEVKLKPTVGADFQFRVNTATDVTSYFYGLHAGALGSLETSRLFTARFGLQYKFSYTNSTVAYLNLQKGDANIFEHSLELPATFGIRFDVFGKMKMHVDIGPTASFIMASNFRTNKDLLSYDAGVTYDMYKKNIMTDRWNIYGCGTASLEIGDFGLIGVGYRYGFLNLCYGDNTVRQHELSLNLIINL